MSNLSRILADKLREDYQTDGVNTSHLSEVFETEPVPLQTYLYDNQYLGLARQNIRLSEIQEEFIRHFEQIYSPETYIALVEQLGPQFAPVRMVHTLAAMWGKGAGKDAVARFSIARTADLLLNLKSPQTYYGLPETDEIQMLNVAVSAPQAHRAFFRPLRNMLVRSPRFREQFRGDAPTDNAKSVLLEKNLELISGHSQAESQEGLNLIAAIADEIGAFKTDTELATTAGRTSAQTAEYILDMLRSSASTRFPRHFKLGIISYPRYENDAIMQAMAKGRADNEKYKEKSTYYVSGPYSTWVVNPRVSRDDPEIANAYTDDPEFAAAKYECQPPKAANRYLRNDHAIFHGFSREEPPAVEIDYYWGIPTALPNEHLPEPKPGWQVKFYFSPDLKPMEGAIYALHGDIALTQDQAGIAMAHVAQYRLSPYEHDQHDPQPVIKIDFVTGFQADLSLPHPDDPTQLAPREVQIRWYRQLVYELIARGFDIARVTFDGFQSQDMIQQFTEYSMTSEVVSLDRNTKVYDEFKNCLYDGRIDGPHHPQLIHELQTLSRLTNNKIDHPPGGSKDLADAVAGATYGAVQEGGTEGEKPTVNQMFTWHNAPNADASLTPVDLSLPLGEVDLGWVYNDTPGIESWWLA